MKPRQIVTVWRGLGTSALGLAIAMCPGVAGADPIVAPGGKPGAASSWKSTANAVTLMIADDYDATLVMLNDSLESWGYEVVRCDDGDAAWSALQGSDGPEIALLDWQMPGLTGIDICERKRTWILPGQFRKLPRRSC